jgi:hypothetical protein
MINLNKTYCRTISAVHLLLFASIVLFYGCTTQQPCFNSPVQPAFIGFSANETYTFILRRFGVNSNFNLAIDSFKIYENYYNKYQVTNDTTTVFVQAGVDSIPLFTGQIQVGYDWQIYIPSVNKTVSISNITDVKKTIKCNSGFPLADDKAVCKCENPIVSMSINGLNYTFPDTTTIFKIFINR